MAFTAPTPAPRARPGTVTVAVIRLYVAALLEVVNAVISIATYGDFEDAYAKAYAGTSLAGQAGSATVTVIASVVIALLLAVIFLVLAILDGRGNRVGRLLTWIFGGLALCCLGSSFALGAFGKSAYESSRKTNPDLPSYDKLQSDIRDALPSWYTPVTTALGIIVLAAVVVVIILLALPASNPYFRKAEEPQWEPPVPPAPPSSYGTPPPSDQPPPGPPGPAGPPPPSWPPTS
jgi:hypothetical protein